MKFSLVMLWVLMSFSALCASQVVIEESFPSAPPTDLDKARIQRQGLRALIAAELKLLGLDAGSYELAYAQRKTEWEKNLRERLAAAELPLTALPTEAFVDEAALLRNFTVVKFARPDDKGDLWQMTLQGEAEPKLLQLHYQRFTKAGALGPRLLFDVRVTPDNFSWEDLQLRSDREFVAPLEREWLGWFVADHLPASVEEMNLCGEACQRSLGQWRAADEAKMGGFVDPWLTGNLLLSVEMTLHREVLEGPVPDQRLTLSGGAVLKDLDSKRTLHWEDLPTEKHVLRQTSFKEFNSALATLCYRAPLGKFLLFKNAGAPLGQSHSLTVRLSNMDHMGQALRLLEWLKAKGSAFSVDGKLDSTKGREARILIFFVGEANKFKPLVSAVKELESEWGKTVRVTDEGETLVYSLPAPKTP